MKKTYESYEAIKDYKKLIGKEGDFEDFWISKLKVLEDFDFKISLEDTKDYPSMKTSYLSFESFDKTRVYAKYLRPKNKAKTPLILNFHGYPGSSRSFFELSSYVEAGFSVLAMDCRGQGGRTKDIGNTPGVSAQGHVIRGLGGDMDDHTYTKIFLDAYLISKLGESLYGISDIYCLGGSQGAALSIVVGAFNKNIKKLALLYPFLADFKKVVDLGFDDLAYEGLRYYLKRFDPDGSRSDEIFRDLSYIDVANFAPYISQDVIFGISLSDDVCPPECQKLVYESIRSNKKLFTFKGYGHEKIPEMEEEVLPFFKEDPLANEDFYESEDKLISKADNECLLIYLNPTIKMSSLYLRRFKNLGYDLISLKNYDRLEGIIKSQRSSYKKICFMAYREAANKAIKDSKLIDGLIIQGVIEDESILPYAEETKAKVLFASLGLDPKTSRDFDKRLIKAFKNIRYLTYPRYEYERIDHFEDKKLDFLEKLKEIS